MQIYSAEIKSLLIGSWNLETNFWIWLYFHYFMIYVWWLLTIIAFADAFPVSWLVLLIYLPLIIRNHIVSAEVMKIEFEDFHLSDYWSDQILIWIYILFWCPFAFCVLTRRSAISKIAMLPNEMAPLSTIIIQIITVIFFTLLYAFFLTDNFRIVCFVFFVVVYFFNTVFYYKPFALTWVVWVLAIPFAIFFSVWPALFFPFSDYWLVAVENKYTLLKSTEFAENKFY